MSATRTIEQHKQQIRRQLLKRPQTLAQIADRINWDVSMNALTRPIGELVAVGEVVKHSGRPAMYSKP